MLMVKAIVAAATAIGGKDPGNALQDIVKNYTNLYYPERAQSLDESVERVKAIMTREFAKGPFKVQAQDYDKKRKKKRR